MPSPEQVTTLLNAAEAGVPGAAADMLPIVYAELRRLAASWLRGKAQTLQPTALVHEAFVRLVRSCDRSQVKWESDRHFFAAAAVAMRSILVDRARGRASLKRGGNRGRRRMEEAEALEADPEAGGVDLVALDAALTSLAARDGRKAEIVMLRYFAGLTVEETALALDLSAATVKREWGFAKALLYDELMNKLA